MENKTLVERLKLFRQQELEKWSYPEKLKGHMVNDLASLIKLINTDTAFTDIYLREHRSSDDAPGFDIYSRNKKLSSEYADVAYGCGGCSNIIVGPPHILRLYDESHPALLFYCRNLNCFTLLYKKKFSISKVS